MKYPLTEQAKSTARALVAAWNAGEIEQRDLLTVSDRIVDNRRRGFITIYGEDLLPSSLRELSLFGLLIIENQQGASYNILLLQELRNAVATDFDVSDYFITMNAVGNIIVNSTTGSVQGIGVNSGTVHQTAEQLADYMSASLGEDFLAANVELKAAIDELRTAVTGDQQSALGKVILQLGNGLQHGANASAIIVALYAAAPFIQKLIGG